MEKNFETLEEGAWYKRRDGKVVGPVRKKKEKAKEDRNRYDFYVSIHTYTKKGFYLQTEYENKLDLIEKVEAPLIKSAQAEPVRNFETLEEGAWYKRRDGKIVGPVIRRKIGSINYTFAAEGFKYAIDGKFFKDDEDLDHRDLVEKIESPGKEPAQTEPAQTEPAAEPRWSASSKDSHKHEPLFEKLYTGPANPEELNDTFDPKVEINSMKDDIRFAEIVFKAYREKLVNASIEAADEALRARRLYKPYASPHEGYGVLMEEVAELFDEIRKKEKDRDLDAMRKEATQVAAVTLRFIVELTEP